MPWLHLTLADNDGTRVTINPAHIISITKYDSVDYTIVSCLSKGGDRPNDYFVREAPGAIYGQTG